MTRRVFGFALVFLTVCAYAPAKSAPAAGPPSSRSAADAELAGEAFGKPVTKSEYNVALMKQWERRT